MSERKYFPISYFYQILSPKAIFSTRKNFKFWQNLLIIIFLNALIMIPVTLYYANMKSYPIEHIIRGIFSPVTDKTYSVLTKGKIRDNEYYGDRNIIKDDKNIIAVLPTKEDIKELEKSKTKQIILKKRELVFVNEGGEKFKSGIRGKFKDLSDLKSKKAVKEFLNEQCFLSNKSSILMFLLITFLIMIYVGTFIFLGFGTLFLYLTKRSKIFSIKTFSECFGLIVNCLGVPTLIAMVASCFIRNPVVVMNFQVFGALLMITFVFYKTHFRDEIKE